MFSQPQIIFTSGDFLNLTWFIYTVIVNGSLTYLPYSRWTPYKIMAFMTSFGKKSHRFPTWKSDHEVHGQDRLSFLLICFINNVDSPLQQIKIFEKRLPWKIGRIMGLVASYSCSVKCFGFSVQDAKERFERMLSINHWRVIKFSAC